MALTTTITSDCATIELTSDLITDYISDQTDRKLTVSVTLNCCSDESSANFSVDVDLDDENLDIGAVKYILDPDWFSWTTTNLKDAVYHITVRLTNTVSEEYTEQQECEFVDCQTKCTVFNYIRDNDDWFNVYTTYKALQWSKQCDDCDCKTSCTLYNRLCYYLGLNTNEDDCGCGNNTITSLLSSNC